MIIVDGFGVEYVVKRHANHLLNALQDNYEVTVNEKGDLYAGIKLKWDYDTRSYRLTMEDYIAQAARKIRPPQSQEAPTFPSPPHPHQLRRKCPVCHRYTQEPTA